MPQDALFDGDEFVSVPGWLRGSLDPWAREFVADVDGVSRSVFVDPAELVWDDFDSEKVA